MKSTAQNHTHLQAAQVSRTDQSLQKSVLFPPRKNLKTKNFLPFKKIKLCNRTAHDRQTRTYTVDA